MVGWNRWPGLQCRAGLVRLLVLSDNNFDACESRLPLVGRSGNHRHRNKAFHASHGGLSCLHNRVNRRGCVNASVTDLSSPSLDHWKDGANDGELSGSRTTACDGCLKRESRQRPLLRGGGSSTSVTLRHWNVRGPLTFARLCRLTSNSWLVLPLNSSLPHERPAHW